MTRAIAAFAVGTVLVAAAVFISCGDPSDAGKFARVTGSDVSLGKPLSACTNFEFTDGSAFWLYRLPGAWSAKVDLDFSYPVPTESERSWERLTWTQGAVEKAHPAVAKAAQEALRVASEGECEGEETAATATAAIESTLQSGTAHYSFLHKGGDGASEIVPTLRLYIIDEQERVFVAISHQR